MPLNTHFLTLSLPLSEVATDPVTAVEFALRQRGEPLRWAITQVDMATGLATIEAVVTTQAQSTP
ncbi:MAG: hypothetical protein RLZZ597_2215 [Cyanobacteriota bacterium]|jgi:hypothetical protein